MSTSGKNELLTQICVNQNIKLTALRKDVLSILLSKQVPMGAYDILEKLKKKRPNAEPPTVYRVLDFLADAKLVHRIESQNAYVCCTQLGNILSEHKAVLLFCKQCQQSFEVRENDILLAIKKIAKKHAFAVDDALIEMKGICQTCLQDVV